MNLIQQDKLPLSAILVTFLATYLARNHLPGGFSETLFQYPKAANWAYQFRYALAALFIYFFFRLVSKTDRNRSHQLRQVGLFDLLRDTAVLFCTYTYFIAIGQAFGLLDPGLSLLPGALSLIVFSAGLQTEMPGKTHRILTLIGAQQNIPARRMFSRGLLIAGTLGLLGTGRLQLIWLVLPLILTPILTRLRHPQGPQ